MDEFILNEAGAVSARAREFVQPNTAFDLQQLFKEWQFYLPDPLVTKNILRLNQLLGESAFARREERLIAREGFNVEDAIENQDWLPIVASQISGILFHEDREAADKISADEVAGFYPKFISERIYNHCAMLTRSRHAQRGGSFSIREELTTEVAGRIGLGLALSSKTPEGLRKDAQAGLNDLAFNFQHWLVTTRKGFHPATWGVLCSSERAEWVRENLSTQPLILETDVSKTIEEVPAEDFAVFQPAVAKVNG